MSGGPPRGEGGTQFLLPEPAPAGARVELPPDEAHHAAGVLRLAAGAVVDATDGRGGRYRLRLARRGRDGWEAEVLDRREEPAAEPRVEVGLGAGRRERFLWCVEKLAELEVARVVPLLSAAVQGRRALERQDGRLAQRARARVAAALKQSLGAHATQVEAPASVAAWAVEPFEGVSFLLAIRRDAAPLALAALDASPALAASVRLAIGPEGGFTTEEERALEEAGFTPAGLGARRLRFETAAIAAVCQLRAALHLRVRALQAVAEDACGS